jgi:hypothetical protein
MILRKMLFFKYDGIRFSPRFFQQGANVCDHCIRAADIKVFVKITDILLNKLIVDIAG